MINVKWCFECYIEIFIIIYSRLPFPATDVFQTIISASYQKVQWHVVPYITRTSYEQKQGNDSKDWWVKMKIR